MWDQRYNTAEYVYGKEPNDFLASIAHRIPVGRTLCLGEGEGRNAVHLARMGHEVLAVDGSSVGLAKAADLAREQGVRIDTLATDLTRYDIERNAWDAIISIFCHVPSQLRSRLHHDVVHGLREGGAFVLEAYTPEQLRYRTGGPPTLDLMMQLSDLKQELDGLAFQRATETRRVVHEGKLHYGTGAVVQILAFK